MGQDLVLVKVNHLLVLVKVDRPLVLVKVGRLLVSLLPASVEVEEPRSIKLKMVEKHG